MLLLSRKPEETIVIGGNITVTVFKLKRGRVLLGVNAPKEVTVHRQEVEEAIEIDKDAA